MSNYRNIDVDGISEMFKALSNPNRLRIFLDLLSCCSPGTVWNMECAPGKCVGDLGQDLQVVPSTISHHIKELRRAGLIRMKRRGRKVECWIDPEVLEELKRFLSGALSGRPIMEEGDGIAKPG